MATPFSDIYDLVTVSIKDYTLDKLYTTSTANFETYMQGFLLKGISKFSNCVKDLSNYDLILKQFNIDLNLTEKVILSNLVVIEWLLKQIQNINQLNLHLNDTDFKLYSEAQNLKEKSDYYNRLREIASQDMVDYGIKNIPWKDWQGGNFGI